jgi:hypothetical protein
VEGGLTVIAKILCISDFHKRYKDSASIKGQLEVQQLIQEELIAFNKANGITHNIVLGDWYDRGFHGLGQAYGSMEMDRRLSESVNGNVYLCIGNHFYLERDENPEMYIIQPNAFIKPQTDIPVPDVPIFKMVQTLQLGTVQIDFFHYNKLNKEYIAWRNPNTTFHIGIYHDDVTLPSWVREQEGFTGTTAQSYLNKIYKNIDLGIHGHIHTKIGSLSIPVDESGRKVPLIVPGSLSITQNNENYKHLTVELPVITIEDDSSVHIELAEFSTHMDMLRFYAPKKKKKTTILDTGIVDTTQVTLTGGVEELQSLPIYLTKKGYDRRRLNLIDAAASDTLNIGTAVRILADVGEII